MRMNAGLSLPEVFEPISQKPQPGSSANQHVTIVHMDNARQHNAVGVIGKLPKMRLKIAHPPPYGPGVAPPEFFLFGWLKSERARRTFATGDKLLDEIDKLMNRLSSETIVGVFREWINGPERVTPIDGESVFFSSRSGCENSIKLNTNEIPDINSLISSQPPLFFQPSYAARKASASSAV
jgi:hypothetical protein